MTPDPNVFKMMHDTSIDINKPENIKKTIDKLTEVYKQKKDASQADIKIFTTIVLQNILKELLEEDEIVFECIPNQTPCSTLAFKLKQDMEQTKRILLILGIIPEKVGTCYVISANKCLVEEGLLNQQQSARFSLRYWGISFNIDVKETE